MMDWMRQTPRIIAWMVTVTVAVLILWAIGAFVAATL